MEELTDGSRGFLGLRFLACWLMINCFPRGGGRILFDDGSPGDFKSIDRQDVLGMNGKISVGTNSRPSIKLGRNIQLSVNVVMY